MSIERDHECYCYLVENFTQLPSTDLLWLLLCVEHFCFFPFEQFAKPVVRIFLFVELIYNCFLFYFLLCKIVVRVLFLFGMLFSFLFTLFKCNTTLNLDSRKKVRCFLLCQVLRNVRNDKTIWL